MLPTTEQILQGNKRAIARLISLLENNPAETQPVLASLYPHTGHAHLIGLTGAPGTGKSTLVNEIAKAYSTQNKTVAILSIDPTSPFTGGAILGDRIRFQDLAGNPNVFARSMATRGSLGGLARAASDAVKVFDAAGYDIIIIETVGVGQAEVDIARLAHSVIVVEAPGLGDEVQAIKAGLLEIADIFVVNKADRQGVSRTVSALRMMLDMSHGRPPQAVMHHGRLMDVPAPPPTEETTIWRPPICQTVALEGEGIDSLLTALAEHQTYQRESGGLLQRERSRHLAELERIITERLLARVQANIPAPHLAQTLQQITDRTLDPYSAADHLLNLVDFS